jgi:hypothetical protein
MEQSWMRLAPTLPCFALLCLAGCPHKEESPRPNHSGQPARKDEPPAPPSAPVAAPAPAAPLGGAAGAGHPRRIPTIAAIDWDAFPDERKLTGRGRTITLKPGRVGVIANALTKARAGDTILLRGGTYREGEDGDHRALPLVRDGVTIRAVAGQRARIVPRSGEVTYGALIAASRIVLSGIELDGFASVGIGFEKEGGTVKDVVLSDVTVKAPKDGKWHDGIVVYHDMRGKGRPASDGLLMRNVVVEGASLGISCNSGPCRSWWLENVRVTGAGGSGSGADAIAVEEGENLVFFRVDVSRVAADGIDLKAKNVLVMGCYVHELARNGVKLWQGGDIVNTVIHHTGEDAAIVFEHAGRYRILNSVMAFHNWPQPTSYNLTASYDSREKLKVELINSIFYKTSGGMFFQDGTDVTIRSCIFHEMKNGNYLRANVKGREVNLTRAGGLKAFRKLGATGVILADPRFVDPVHGDFRLRSGSPAANRGVRVGAMPPFDVAGGPRVRGAAPDIGAYEMF